MMRTRKKNKVPHKDSHTHRKAGRHQVSNHASFSERTIAPVDIMNDPAFTLLKQQAARFPSFKATDGGISEDGLSAWVSGPAKGGTFVIAAPTAKPETKLCEDGFCRFEYPVPQTAQMLIPDSARPKPDLAETGLALAAYVRAGYDYGQMGGIINSNEFFAYYRVQHARTYFSNGGIQPAPFQTRVTWEEDIVDRLTQETDRLSARADRLATGALQVVNREKLSAWGYGVNLEKQAADRGIGHLLKKNRASEGKIVTKTPQLSAEEMRADTPSPHIQSVTQFHKAPFSTENDVAWIHDKSGAVVRMTHSPRSGQNWQKVRDVKWFFKLSQQDTSTTLEKITVKTGKGKSEDLYRVQFQYHGAHEMRVHTFTNLGKTFHQPTPYSGEVYTLFFPANTGVGEPTDQDIKNVVVKGLNADIHGEKLPPDTLIQDILNGSIPVPEKQPAKKKKAASLALPLETAIALNEHTGDPVSGLQAFSGKQAVAARG